MKLIMCSILDTVAAAWLTPMFFQSEAQGLRSFSDAVNDGDSPFWKHPEDYKLFKVGTFDPATGMIEPLVAGPEILAVGVNLVEAKEAPMAVVS